MISLSSPTKPAADWGSTAPKPAPRPGAAPAPAPAPVAGGAPPPTGVQLPLVQPLTPQINVQSTAAAKPVAGAPPAPAAGGIPAIANGSATAAAHVPGAQLAAFGPQGDLRGQQVLPGQGADRYQIAQQRYDKFVGDNQQNDFDMTRMIGQRAAAAGRLGAGSVDDEYNRLARTLGDRNASARGGFLSDALEGTIGDQRSNRDEVRTERGYQSGAAQQHLDNQYRELDANQRVGYQGGDPWATLLQGSGDLGQQAGQSAQGIYDLLRQYAYGRSVDPNLDQYGQPGGVPSNVPGSRSDPNVGASTLYGQRPGTSYYGS